MNLPELPEPMGYVPFAGEFYQADQLDQEVKDDAETVWCFSMQQLRAYAEEAVRMEREECAKAIEALRDDHCAGTKLSPDKTDWCERDDQCCEFVVAWNEAAAKIRSRTAVPAKE